MIHCTFCGKSQDDVAKLIAGPDLGSGAAHICDECVDLCARIVAEVAPPTQPATRRGGIELARLRLQAFAIVADWGSKNEAGAWERWGMARRMETAELLTEWAMAEPLTVDAPGQ